MGNSKNIIPKADSINPELQKYPHVTDPKTKHDSRYDPDTYISVQTRVNHDSKFEKMYISKIVSEGWVALKRPEDILIFPKGRSFKYRLNGESMSGAPEGTFRSGGWLMGKNLEDSENNDKYIMYKGYNGAIFSLQIKDLLEVYILSKKREIPVFKKPDPNTENQNFPVFLPHPETGKNKIVYFARDNCARTRFMNSKKYSTAKMLGIWSWAATFNENNIYSNFAILNSVILNAFSTPTANIGGPWFNFPLELLKNLPSGSIIT